MRSSNIDPEMEDYDVDAAFGGMPARAQNRRRVSTTERAQRPVRRPTPDADDQQIHDVLGDNKHKTISKRKKVII